MNDDATEPRKHRLGRWAGLLVLLLLLVLPAPDGLSAAGWRTAAVGLLMAIWWITEALPIPATALVPLVLLPVLGIAPIGDAASPYANPIIFLFMGGFVIAIAMQRWDLHRRIALGIVARVGTRPKALVMGFILASALLSMWVSNTATALMMLPIGLSIIALTEDRLAEVDPGAAHNFSLVLVLSIAYACNVGGIGTLVGTPPNALMAGFMQESYGFEIGFAQWMGVGLPLVAVALPLVYVVLTRVYPIGLDELPGGASIIRSEREKLGAMTAAERRVALLFVATALCWMTRPLLEAWVTGLSDAGIAMTAALLLFVLPSGTEPGRRLLDWSDLESLPWGVLILFGGGLSLAAAISDTGLAAWIGQGVGGLEAWPLLLIVVAAVALIVFLTEITSNTATTAAFLPIMASVAVGLGQNPLLLAVPAAIGASCAFMLPVATPPNAIVYGSERVTIPEMSRAGLWLNLISIVFVTVLAYTLLLWVFGIQPGTLPDWAG